MKIPRFKPKISKFSHFFRAVQRDWNAISDLIELDETSERVDQPQIVLVRSRTRVNDAEKVKT